MGKEVAVMDELDEGDTLWLEADKAAHDFGQACAKFRDRNPYSEIDALDAMINTLMTELWDGCFSQTEIRDAFEAAIADMNRYAAGDERRP
jgi:hypothetical protein